jgi:hypothetical protein
MASALTSAVLSQEMKVEIWDHDPGTTAALVASPDGGTTDYYLDGRDYDAFMFLVNPSVLTGTGVTLVELCAADDTTGTNLTVIVSSGAVVADTILDYVMVECTAAQIGQLSGAGGYDLRYVTVRITVQNSADEAKVTAIAGKAKAATSGLTATYIS